MEEIPLLNLRRPDHSPACSNIPLPESPRLPMEFLSRSWSVSALEVSKSLSCMASNKSASNSSCTTSSSILEDVTGEMTEEIMQTNPSANYQFSFASSTTSQLLLERIMSQSEVSPLASGRLSHSSGPLNLTESDSPQSHRLMILKTLLSCCACTFDADGTVTFSVQYFRSHNSINPLFNGGRASAGPGSGAPPTGSKTVGRWLKDRKEKKKEETRAQNAQLHAAVSVAAVASSIAAIAAATAASSAAGRNEQLAKTDMAVASAATLVAAQCVEAAEAMGAERDHLASVLYVGSNLEGKSIKGCFECCSGNSYERCICGAGNNGHPNRSYSDELVNGENFLGACSVEFLARAVNFSNAPAKDRTDVVVEVCKDMPAWPGRHLLDGGDHRRYFGLKTLTRGIVEFECKNQREHDIWTQGVSRLLSIVSQRKNRIHQF
uniref:VAN3-binding protein-like auxin canalisation domain-containing protein n=1 Tax=Salix viminalis TaxID=40686 RepID=A0A6N2LR88_SALVM